MHLNRNFSSHEISIKVWRAKTKSGGDKVAKASGDAVMSAFNAAVNARKFMRLEWLGSKLL